MMKRHIWKFSLPFRTQSETGATSHIEMPEQAEILSVGMQENSIVLWAFVTPNWPRVKRVIDVYATGQLVEVVGHPYLGTVQTKDRVWHVFDGGEEA